MVRRAYKSRKGDSGIGGRGRRTKEGVYGIAAAYMTRNQALKKLQISLKDFRRLCILKGIFPRDPKKKKQGTDKTYYHHKDILYLSHEPLLDKFRQLKIALRKYKTAIVKREKIQAEKIKKGFPKLTLDHLVRERYPTFIDAIRDLDDALSLIFLFASLPMRIIPLHTEEIANKTNRIANEWLLFNASSHSLRKVFVSIKGVYFQANLHGQAVTWLVPHKFSQYIPTDVDYRVMLTFLSFYLTLTRFVQFKLYYDQGWKYPPLLDESKESQRMGLRAWAIERRAIDSSTAASSSAGSDAMILATTSAVSGEDERVQLDDFSKLNGGGKDEKIEGDNDANKEAEQIRQALDEEKEASSVFRSLFFYLSRETPQEALEFVIRCGGGDCVCESSATALTAQQLSQVTHFIIDRPSISQISSALQSAAASKEAVQPQWVFDSFNMRVPLPIAPYAVGVVPPPHISPFVDDEKEGYKPKQRAVLEQWAAAQRGKLLTAENGDEEEANEDADDEGDEEDEDDDEEEDNEENMAVMSKDEVRFQRGLQRELRALRTAAGSAESDDENLVDDGEEQKEKDEVDSSDEEAAEQEAEEEEEEEEEEQPKLSKKQAKTLAKEEKAKAKASVEKELAMTLMSRKDARLYSRIQYGLNKKKEAAETLLKKRKEIEKVAKKADKLQKSSSTNAEENTVTKKRKVGKKQKHEDAEEDDIMQ